MANAVVVKFALKSEEQEAMLVRVNLNLFVRGFEIEAGANEGAASWKKAQFQDQINWCGWSVHFGHDTYI